MSAADPLAVILAYVVIGIGLGLFATAPRPWAAVDWRHPVGCLIILVGLVLLGFVWLLARR